MGEILEILISASFWAAAIRIATPLDIRYAGRADLRAGGRAQPGYRGHHDGRRHGWLDGRLSRRADLWTGVLFAAALSE